MTTKNYCIIMAGGIGSRFWPFSREEKPKQFLDFFGTGRSLLQMTFDRLLKIVSAENIIIVTSINYKKLVLNQLPLIKPAQVLTEPMRRNTAPCIAYASNKIKSICDDANILVVPADQLVLKEDEFVKTIKAGFDFVSKNDCLLTLGMSPTRPETAYGYIQVEDDGKNPGKVKTFTEKPNSELAKIFFESGEFYWNSGMFLWNVNSILKAFDSFLPEIAYKFKNAKDFYNTAKEQEYINEIYPTCQNISIDYGIMEKADNVYVITADFGWSDCGTWAALHEYSSKDANGNALLGGEAQFYDCKNNIVALNDAKMAVIQGLENYVIAESNGVLMICPKDDEQKMRQYVNDINVRFNGEFN
ncbi:MAG: mannose-1-phosphate guanylyltransferase [Paludibacteraceae bacterium]|nr:mannose-1-phosphate guanylyltransferase [Paludibacteraceae bacterium]MBO7723846.1 mannose-1-phosphate guanylyltransferase [Paludibacteraceae bacterium]